MKLIYTAKAFLFFAIFLPSIYLSAQTPTITTQGVCAGVVADFNTNDNGFNSPSLYGSVFDSSFYFNTARGNWTDYLPPTRVAAPGFPRVQNLISPPYFNPNAIGTFNVGFYYIVNNPLIDRFQIRIISVTQTPMGTVTNVEATSGLQTFAAWSTPVAYTDNGPNPTPFLNGFQGTVCMRLIDPDITNGPNTSYRVELSYIINEAFFAVFDNFSIGPLNSPLPVNFIGIVANRNTTDNSVQLKWDVSEEVNVKEYNIERSLSGTTFTKIGANPSKGKSIYSYTDYTATAGTIFYRIKSIDIDGRSKYSSIISIKGNSSGSFSDKLMLYPVPANDEVTVQHKKVLRDAKITISSIDGKILGTIIPAEGASHTPIKIGGLNPGLYLVRFEDGTGYSETAKLIKN
jgi:Secretion system C-terminal sorting domain